MHLCLLIFNITHMDCVLQVEQQDLLLSQLQAELKAERSRQQDASRQLQQSKKQIVELEDEIEAQQKSQRDLTNRVFDFIIPPYANKVNKAILMVKSKDIGQFALSSLYLS